MEVILEDPCDFTEVLMPSIPVQNFYAWDYPDPASMSFSIPFEKFKAEVAETHGVDCGEFSYSLVILT